MRMRELESVNGLIELKKFPMGELKGTLYIPQGLEKVNTADQEQLFALAQEAFPGYPTDEIMKDLFDNPNRVVIVRNGQTIVAASSSSIFLKRIQLLPTLTLPN